MYHLKYNLNKIINFSVCIFCVLFLTLFSAPSSLFSENDVSPLYIEPDPVFIQYVERFSPGISAGDAWVLVQEGYVIVDALSQNQLAALQEQSEKERLHQANAVVWYLMWRASTEEVAFTEGMFDLPDPDGRYWHFFKSIPGSYGRLSSHYAGRVSCAHIGVDLFPEEGEVLPAAKRTLVFNLMRAVDGTQRLYLKPEDHGVSWKKPREFARHTWDYVRSRPIICAFSPRPAPIPFREELPQAAKVKAFREVVQQLPLTKQAKGQGLEWARKYGYAGMVHFLTKEHAKLGVHDAAYKKVQQFMQMLAEAFPDEDLQSRTGHEVVVRKEWVHLPQN